MASYIDEIAWLGERAKSIEKQLRLARTRERDLEGEVNGLRLELSRLALIVEALSRLGISKGMITRVELSAQVAMRVEDEAVSNRQKENEANRVGERGSAGPSTQSPKQ